ncbi:hypothetical protein M758_9G138400 [Ceratodon purpureus]|nr:hypothetical protein M758_9G138400 [Ceratodon purpureus]
MMSDSMCKWVRVGGHLMLRSTMLQALHCGHREYSVALSVGRGIRTCRENGQQAPLKKFCHISSLDSPPALSSSSSI